MSENTLNRIKEQIAQHKILLYMKGTPEQPQCGFSAQTCQALKACGANFTSVNVLEEPEIRQELPKYANWPTFPQLYIHGELIGGCDIVLDLYRSGKLQEMLVKV